jgi:hypothetical protein
MQKHRIQPNYFKRMLVCANASYVKGPVETVRHLMLGAAHPQQDLHV